MYLSSSSSPHVLPLNHNVLAFSSHCQSEGLGTLSRTLGAMNDSTVRSLWTELGTSTGPSRLLVAKHRQVPQPRCVRQTAPRCLQPILGTVSFTVNDSGLISAAFTAVDPPPSHGTCAQDSLPTAPRVGVWGSGLSASRPQPGPGGARQGDATPGGTDGVTWPAAFPSHSFTCNFWVTRGAERKAGEKGPSWRAVGQGSSPAA